MPASWLEDAPRLDKAGVPPEQRRALSKGEIALELLDAVRAEGVLPGQVASATRATGSAAPDARDSPRGGCTACSA